MNLLEKAIKARESKKEVSLEDAHDIPDEGKPKKSSVRIRTPKPTKLIVPEHIKILFENLDKSINSAWGIQSNGKVKWDAKYSMWIAFKNWFEEVSK